MNQSDSRILQFDLIARFSLLQADVVRTWKNAILALVHCNSPNLNFKPGAHNDVRAEGKGRSVQRPCKRVKFENVLTVVPLLFLASTRIASLTDYRASKVAKIVVRHKK